jgi:hypothetical protein
MNRPRFLFAWYLAVKGLVLLACVPFAGSDALLPAGLLSLAFALPMALLEGQA